MRALALLLVYHTVAWPVDLLIGNSSHETGPFVTQLIEYNMDCWWYCTHSYRMNPVIMMNMSHPIAPVVNYTSPRDHIPEFQLLFRAKSLWLFSIDQRKSPVIFVVSSLCIILHQLFTWESGGGRGQSIYWVVLMIGPPPETQSHRSDIGAFRVTGQWYQVTPDIAALTFLDPNPVCFVLPRE